MCPATDDSKNCTLAARTSSIGLHRFPALAVDHRQVVQIVLWPVLQANALLSYWEIAFGRNGAGMFSRLNAGSTGRGTLDSKSLRLFLHDLS